MNLTWSQLANAFQVQAQFVDGYSLLYRDIFAHAAGILTKQARAETLEFDETALVKLLETGYRERTFEEPVIESTLLLTAAIHLMVLADLPEAQPISRFFATVGGSYEPDYDQDVLHQMLGGLYLHPPVQLIDFLKRGRIQTNEVSRGVAWLLPTLLLTAWADEDLPITLIDLGCSAGLNLAADAQSWAWSAADGERTLNAEPGLEPLIRQTIESGIEGDSLLAALGPGPLRAPHIIKRLGLDLFPIDLAAVGPEPGGDARLALRACIWGDHPERLARLDQAITRFLALDPPAELQTADIISAAATLYERIPSETRLVVIYNTTVTLYIPDAAYERLRQNVETCFRAMPPHMRGLWFELELARPGESAIPAGHYALKVHRLDPDGVLRMMILATTNAHPQHIRLTQRWEILQ
jgi:hypothetical protein